LGLFAVSSMGVTEATAQSTQADFAVALGKRLGLCDGTDAYDCINALKAAGIECPDGWRPDQPMTCACVSDLTDDVIVWAKPDSIPLMPQRAVDLLAATALDLGLCVKEIYVAAYDRLGYYFPPSIPALGGSSGGFVSVER
jgi:hypothetical protein